MLPIIALSITGSLIRSNEKDYLSLGIEIKKSWTVKSFPYVVAAVLLGSAVIYLKGQFYL